MGNSKGLMNIRVEEILVGGVRSSGRISDRVQGTHKHGTLVRENVDCI